MRIYKAASRLLDQQSASSHDTISILAARVLDAERAAGMTAMDRRRAGIIFIMDIRERLAAWPVRARRAYALDACIQEALENRLREALDKQAERERSARLHAMLGLSAKPN